MKVPYIDNDLSHLVPYVETRVEQLLIAMRGRGFHPRVFETLRTKERQAYLYGQGRTKMQCIWAGISAKWADPKAKRVTETMQSLHRKGKAADIIEVGKGWSNPAFFDALAEEARKFGLHTLGWERCHVEWRG